jgi:hypothetical protein
MEKTMVHLSPTDRWFTRWFPHGGKNNGWTSRNNSRQIFGDRNSLENNSIYEEANIIWSKGRIVWSLSMSICMECWNSMGEVLGDRNSLENNFTYEEANIIWLKGRIVWSLSMSICMECWNSMGEALPCRCVVRFKILNRFVSGTIRCSCHANEQDHWREALDL